MEVSQQENQAVSICLHLHECGELGDGGSKQAGMGRDTRQGHPAGTGRYLGHPPAVRAGHRERGRAGLSRVGRGGHGPGWESGAGPGREGRSQRRGAEGNGAEWGALLWQMTSPGGCCGR